MPGASPASMRAAARSRRGSSIRTRTCCSLERARTSSSLRQRGRRLPRDPPSRRRDPLDRRGDTRGVRGRAAGPRPPVARGDARPRRDDRSRRSRATASTWKPSSGSSRWRTGWARRARSTSCRRSSARTPSRRSTATRPDGTEAYVDSVVEEQLPGVAAQGVARFCDVFCETGVFSAAQSRRVLEAAARLRPAAAAACRRARAIRRRGAGRRARCRLGRPPRAPRRTPGIEALAAAAETDTPVVATLLPATTWFLMKDHYAPARAFIERGVPVAIGTDFNPGTSPTPNLPLVMSMACVQPSADAGRGTGGRDHQRRPRRLALEEETARSSRASRRTSSSGGVPTSSSCPTGRARTSCGPSSSAAASCSSGGLTRIRGAGRQACLPRDSSRTVVVSSGRLDGVTDSFGCVHRLGAHLVEELGQARRSRLRRRRSASGRRSSGRAGRRAPPPGRRAARHRGGRTRCRPSRYRRASPRTAGARCRRGGSRARHRSRREGDALAALRAARIVAVGADAGDEHVLDLVFAGPVQHEGAVEARRQQRPPVARWRALGSGQRLVVRVAEGDDVAGDPAPGRPDDRLVRVVDDDRVLAAQPDTGPAVPSQFHRRRF